jgi:hypothetical protein
MSPTDLPAASVAATTALAGALSAWSAAHPECTLGEAEAAVLQAVRAALPTLLERVLAQTQRAWQTLPVRCPTCHHGARVWDWRPRQVLSLCGPVRWERPWVQCPRCQTSFGAGDASLALAPYQRQSPGVAALLVAFGSVTDFREAAALLAQSTGLLVSPETLRRTTEATGHRIAATAAAAVASYVQGAEPAVVDAAPGRLVAETDGVFVRDQDDWHEVKIGAVGGWQSAPPAAADGQLTALSYVAAREDSRPFAPRLGAEVARRGGLTVVGWHGSHRGGAELRPLVLLGDGATWIWGSVADQFGTVTEIVDYFHAGEHLSTVAGLLYGAGTAAASAWAAARRDELRTRGVDAMLPQLAVPAGLQLSADSLAKLRTEQGYFHTNRARMQYPHFRERGLPLGSGAVESSAKPLIQQRLKRAGMRWSDAGGRALIALRADRATLLAQAA